MSIFKKYLRLIIILFALSAVFLYWSGSIEQSSPVDLKDYGSITHLKKYEKDNIIQVFKGNELASQGECIIQVVEIEGYKGKIQILVSIDTRYNKVSSIEVLSHHETEDYGGYLTQGWFLDRFKNKEFSKPLEMVKVIAKAPNEIVAITGATKTSSAVVEGVNKCLENYKRIKGE